jgi:excisionase family DNA binding protein
MNSLRLHCDPIAQASAVPPNRVSLMFAIIVNQDGACRLIADMPAALPASIGSLHTTPDPAPAIVGPELLDVDKMAALLGVARRTVERWEASGKLIKSIRIGRLRHWRRDEVHAWISRLDSPSPSQGPTDQ